MTAGTPDRYAALNAEIDRLRGDPDFEREVADSAAVGVPVARPWLIVTSWYIHRVLVCMLLQVRESRAHYRHLRRVKLAASVIAGARRRGPRQRRACAAGGLDRRKGPADLPLRADRRGLGRHAPGADRGGFGEVRRGKQGKADRLTPPACRGAAGCMGRAARGYSDVCPPPRRAGAVVG